MLLSGQARPPRGEGLARVLEQQPLERRSPPSPGSALRLRDSRTSTSSSSAPVEGDDAQGVADAVRESGCRPAGCGSPWRGAGPGSRHARGAAPPRCARRSPGRAGRGPRPGSIAARSSSEKRERAARRPSAAAVRRAAEALEHELAPRPGARARGPRPARAGSARCGARRGRRSRPRGRPPSAAAGRPGARGPSRGGRARARPSASASSCRARPRPRRRCPPRRRRGRARNDAKTGGSVSRRTAR